MRQVLFFSALHLVGTLLCLAVGARARVSLACALGFLIGLGAVIPAVLLLAVIGVPFGKPLILGVMAALAAASLLALRRGGWPPRRTWLVVALSTAAAAVLAIPTALVNVAYLTFDSHLIVALGRVLSDDGGFEHGIVHQLGDRAPFHMVAQATASLVRREFLPGLYPAIGLSLVAAFATALWHGLGAVGVTRRRLVLVALVTAGLFTVPILQLHVVYVHENLGSAAYLLVFAACFWLAEVEDEPGLVPIAFVALTAFALHRIENPIAAVLFLAIALPPSRLPRRAVVPWFTIFVVAVAGWNLYLFLGIPEGDAMKLGATRIAVMIAAPLALYLAWLAAGRIALVRRVEPHAPVIVAALAGLALFLAFFDKTGTMTTSAEAIAENLTSHDEYGGAWIAIALCAALGLAVERPPARRVFTFGVPLYLGFVLLIAYEHGHYVEARTDSSMRMSLHVLPAAFFYVGLQLGMLFTSSGPPPLRGTTRTA